MTRAWTSEEEQMLLALRAAGLSWLLAAQRLGRSEAALHGRIKVLQLRNARKAAAQEPHASAEASLGA